MHFRHRQTDRRTLASRDVYFTARAKNKLFPPEAATDIRQNTETVKKKGHT